MSMLEQVQQNFCEAIFNKKIDSQDFISSSYPNERLAIYRATIFENLRNCLALTFPGIWKLLGEDCANSVAYVFSSQQQHMPTTGCLDDWGHDFPHFLAAQPELQHLPYLQDYAQYEWLMHRSYCSLDATIITAQDLEKIPEDKIENIRIMFIPSVFLLTTQFPVNSIQDIIENPDAPAIDLQGAITNVVIARPYKQVISIFVAQDIGLFFKYLQEGQTLGQASTDISSKHPDFDLTMAIHLLLKHSLIQEII